MLFGEILRLAALRAPRKVALIAGDREVSYAELDGLANGFANFLLASGVRPGDRIACLLRNSPEYAVIHFGVARAGGVAVHVPPGSAPAEITHILDRTEPRILVAGDDRVPFGGLAIPASLDGCLGDPTPPGVRVHPDDPAAMTFTGGTTGRPRGAVASHRARYLSALSTALEHGLTDRDVVAAVTPMSHAVGLLIWLQAAMVAGASSVLFRRWDPDAFAAEAERRRIRAAFLVPVQVRDLLSRTEPIPRSFVNLGVGGATSPPDLIAAWRERFPWCGYADHYGQSETGPLTILKPWDAAARPETIGQPAHGVELRIAGPDGASLPPGETGELIVRGPFLMDGYYEDPEETAGYFRNGDGWGWTGDLGRADEDGFVTLVGRSVQKIVTGGISVHPREIEAGLESHPEVLDCAVFGVPDERWGEAPIALVEVRNPVSTDDLRRHLDERLARYKRPREIVLTERIVRTASGKVRKAELRAAFLAERS